jgi:hypothetical protein
MRMSLSEEPRNQSVALEKRMVRAPTHLAPTHAGDMLLEEFLMPRNMILGELRSAILVPYQRDIEPRASKQ